MVQKKVFKKLKQSPTLNTILMVEDTLKNAENSIIKISQLKKILPKKINHNMLKIILEYLEKSRKIYVSIKGITWIENDDPRFQAILDKATRYPEDFPKK